MAYVRTKSRQYQYPRPYIPQIVYTTGVDRGRCPVRTRNVASTSRNTTRSRWIQHYRRTQTKRDPRRNCNLHKETVHDQIGPGQRIWAICQTFTTKQPENKHHKRLHTSHILPETPRHNWRLSHDNAWRHHGPNAAPTHNNRMWWFQRKNRIANTPTRYSPPPQNSKWFAHLPKSQVAAFTMY